MHDFLVLSAAVFTGLNYHGEVVARARLNNIGGYRLAVQSSRVWSWGNLVVQDEVVESHPWQGGAGELVDGAREVAHDLADRLFIAGGVTAGAYFFDAEGNYTGER